MLVYINVGPHLAVHAGYDDRRRDWFALGRDDRIFHGRLNDVLTRAVRYRHIGETITREEAEPLGGAYPDASASASSPSTSTSTRLSK